MGPLPQVFVVVQGAHPTVKPVPPTSLLLVNYLPNGLHFHLIDCEVSSTFLLDKEVHINYNLGSRFSIMLIKQRIAGWQVEYYVLPRETVLAAILADLSTNSSAKIGVIVPGNILLDVKVKVGSRGF